MRTSNFAEVVVASGASVPSGATVPIEFTGFTGGPFSRGNLPACGHARGARLAVWDGFAPRGWTDDGVDVEMDEGDFELATCSATPRRSLLGRAAAIVPGFVYALRLQDDGEEPGGDTVVVFLPRATLAGVAADPTAPLQASNVGAFTRLTFRLGHDGAGAASLRLSPAAMSLWARMRRTQAPLLAWDDEVQPHDALLLGIDVARQGDAELGTLAVALPPHVSDKPYARLIAAAQAARRASLAQSSAMPHAIL